MRQILILAALWSALLILAPGAHADDLFNQQSFAHVAADQSARRRGDIITIVVYQNAEARNAAQNTSRISRSFEGGVQSGSIDESAALSLNGAYAGQGEVRRSESFITQISATVTEVLPTGDLLIAGEQRMRVNGEETWVVVRGRVRPSDISGDNRVLSSRLADAEISYNGRGFVSRNARGSFIHRLFRWLGLGG